MEALQLVQRIDPLYNRLRSDFEREFHDQHIPFYGKILGPIQSLLRNAICVNVGHPMKPEYFYIGKEWVQDAPNLEAASNSQALMEQAIHSVLMKVPKASISLKPLQVHSSSFEGTYAQFRRFFHELEALGIFIPNEAWAHFLHEQKDSYEIRQNEIIEFLTPYQDPLAPRTAIHENQENLTLAQAIYNGIIEKLQEAKKTATLASLRGLSKKLILEALKKEGISTYGTLRGLFLSFVGWASSVDIGTIRSPCHIYVGKSWLSNQLPEGEQITPRLVQLAIDNVLSGQKAASISVKDLFYNSEKETVTGTYGNFRIFLQDIERRGIILPQEAKDLCLRDVRATYTISLQELASNIILYSSRPFPVIHAEEPALESLLKILQEKKEEQLSKQVLETFLLHTSQAADDPKKMHRALYGTYGHFSLLDRFQIYLYLSKSLCRTYQRPQILASVKEWVRSLYEKILPKKGLLNEQEKLFIAIRKELKALEQEKTEELVQEIPRKQRRASYIEPSSSKTLPQHPGMTTLAEESSESSATQPQPLHRAHSTHDLPADYAKETKKTLLDAEYKALLETYIKKFTETAPHKKDSFLEQCSNLSLIEKFRLCDELKKVDKSYENLLIKWLHQNYTKKVSPEEMKSQQEKLLEELYSLLQAKRNPISLHVSGDEESLRLKEEEDILKWYTEEWLLLASSKQVPSHAIHYYSIF